MRLINLGIIFFTMIIWPTIPCFAQCNQIFGDYSDGFDEIEAKNFSFLDNELQNVKVVGYGEDTHGTSEFTILANEMMKYLVEKHDFTILIIETGFGEGAYLNDYIHGKADDLEFILKNHNSTWRYRTKEFHAFMDWLRVHNDKNKKKISIYGCEMQYVISDLNRIQDYLKIVNSDYIITGFDKFLWQDINIDEKQGYFSSYFELKKQFIEHKSKFIELSTIEEYTVANQHVDLLGQFVTTITQTVEQRKHDLRDIYMAQNVQWILNFHGISSKALYWAHNAHVGDWVANGNVDVTGHQLRKALGASYYNIATDFGTGSFLAYPYNANEVGWTMQTHHFEKIIENTFTKCLNQIGKPNVFLNLRKAKVNKELKAYLEGPLTSMSGAGALARENKTETNDIGKAFDGIIYINRTAKINLKE